AIPSPAEGFEEWYRTWGVLRGGNRPTAGGPSLVQHFRGAAATGAVLQALRGAPVADVNANFFLDRDVDAPVAEFFALMGGPIAGPTFDFADDVQEFGPSNEPHVHSYPELDPDGVLPG